MSRYQSILRLGAAGLLAALAVSAQTLQQAEALWKARRFQDANTAFQQLTVREPKNPDYKVAWGRMFMDHGSKDDLGNAADLFNEALQVKPDHSGALTGLALLAADGFDPKAAQLAKRALASDPKNVEAQELLARLALEDNDNPKTIEEARKALAIDPNAVQAKAMLATLDWLADKKESPWDPHTAKGYEVAGYFFVMNRRYDEAIGYFRKAIELDPQLYSARSRLGINLMRMGEDKEAYDQLKICFDNGFQNSATMNSLMLMDTYKDYQTFTTPNTILRLSKKESDLLKPYFESEMQRIIATYEKKYGYKLQRPVRVEVYPNHDDFAVRTLGLPGLGALGVTFGHAIAMDSPSGRPPGSFHWASTLWHEMSHVFTLTITNHRVPRWFTEGMAVHEETAVSPEWGDRLGPDEIAAIKGKKLLPITELDRGFVHPTTPVQVLVSYFQAGRICDYINEKWGWPTLMAMLKDFGNNEDTATVVRKNLKIVPEEFDKQFVASVEKETANVVAHFDDWKKALKQISDAVKAKDWDAVIKEGTAIRDHYPDYVEDHSIYELLAEAYLAKDNKPAAIAELQRYMRKGGRNPDSLMLLAKQLEAAGKKKEAAAALERLNFIYPMGREQHQLLGTLWLEEGNNAGAIREFRAVIAAKPIDVARAHYDLARALQADGKPEAAKDELINALETAPGYRQAQKLLLELSETGTTQSPARKQE